MAVSIKGYGDAVRRGMGVIIVCRGCAKTVTYRLSDLDGWIKNGEDVERVRWRCSSCRNTPSYVRYMPLDKVEREALSQWKPPKLKGPASLPDRIEQRYRSGRNTVLSPATAVQVAIALRALEAHPTREEVMRQICTAQQKCTEGCFVCMGKANAIIRLFQGDR